MIYYSTQRPVGPGTFPKVEGNKVLEIVNFDDCQAVESIGKMAWGYIKYEKPLSEKEAAAYELVAAERVSREKFVIDAINDSGLRRELEKFDTLTAAEKYYNDHEGIYLDENGEKWDLDLYIKDLKTLAALEAKELTAVTKAWKVYGFAGHRQGQSFGSSYSFDFSKNGDVRRIEVENADKTGTNEYSIIRITRNSEEECDREFVGQLWDGIFENSRVGKIEEIPAEQPNEKDIEDLKAERAIDIFEALADPIGSSDEKAALYAELTSLMEPEEEEEEEEER